MRSIVLISASALALAATPAAARNGAWYVGGDFGATIVEDANVDFNSSAKVSVGHNTGFEGALFVGYDLGAFRLEAEGSYTRASLDRFTNSFFISAPGTTIPPGTHDVDGHVNALSFMVNGMFDFGDDDGLSGFVGGGVGIARVDYNNVRAFANQDPYIDDGDTRFAWQVVAGVRMAVSSNIDVTVKYRFFNVENLKFEDIGGFKGDSSFRSHSLLGGITFNFGAPPPPPPEVQTSVPQPPLPPAEALRPQQPQP
jgi:opacity protein-like surface antigen